MSWQRLQRYLPLAVRVGILGWDPIGQTQATQIQTMKPRMRGSRMRGYSE